MVEPLAPYCQIRKTLRKLETLDAKLKKEYQLSLDEAILLCCLSQNCKCQGNIATETGLTPTQASRLLSKLEDKALVSRTIGEQDKRKMVFTLTNEGKEKLQQITPAGSEFLTL